MKRNILLFIIILTVLTACQSTTSTLPKNIEDYSITMADNLLASLQENDYKNFSRDFSEELFSSFTQEMFVSLQETILEDMGAFQAMVYGKTTREDAYLISYFDVQFEQGDLTLVLVLQPESPYLIEGFWFPDFQTE